ncbi:GLPGLI family protein [Flavisolibacter ginsenosidimutans]|uniref:GLPGLI family protein n=1 Tax=Flavisolibacter ginsenosidimutans TaxID=661481 RepID=A0A5B8UEN0_9BACT|nr:GLPGLI family protein [Flavisolibacter ginsenosidimutans]QEC55024.1 GLPGLI family protein [Flavisolibacter ginsenosidimutans]
MKQILSFVVFFLSGMFANAQTFHPAVKIEFEKVVYVRQQMKELASDWFDIIKDRLPEKAVSYYEFIGDTLHSIYRQTKEAVIPQNMWYQGTGEGNVVYNDYALGQTITKKPVAEETFLINDSLTKIRWKLTNDTRTIAGYDCKKAIGFIDDTLAVFAFYTDEILITGGPESIHGLPGMVLGLGVPRLHASWFATKVETNGVPLAGIKPETKGRKSTRGAMMATLDNILKNWGKYGSAMRLNYVL